MSAESELCAKITAAIFGSIFEESASAELRTKVCFAPMTDPLLADLAPATLAVELKQRFGFDSFRPGQEAIVRDILRGRDVLAIMPTAAASRCAFSCLPCFAPVSASSSRR